MFRVNVLNVIRLVDCATGRASLRFQRLMTKARRYTV
jgi:hypothetical protein